MTYPEKLKYSKEHTWVKIENEIGIVGISDFAQNQLGEIVYVDLPDIGDEFGQDEIFGSIEALKTVSDLFMPISGAVIEINENINDNPENINNKPYTDGWLIRIAPSNLDELKKLLSLSNYRETTKTD